MVFTGSDAKLLKGAFLDAHLAFSADLFFTAKGLDIHTDLPGGFDDIGPFGYFTSAPRGLEDNFYLFGITHSLAPKTSSVLARNHKPALKLSPTVKGSKGSQV
jgi:hypothetical protein